MDMQVRALRLDGYAVAIWLHSEVDPAKHSWDEGIDLLLRDVKRDPVPPSRFRHLVLSDGGAPNAAQRGRMSADLFRGEKVLLAVITNALVNPVKRGVATALSWINPTTAFFPPSQAQLALDHLGLSAHAVRLWSEYGEMQRAMRPVKVLAETAVALRLRPHA